MHDVLGQDVDVRTTLDLDKRVLAVATSRARVRGISLGQAVSELALEGYEAEASAMEVVSGFPMLPRVPGHVITDEMVDAALSDSRVSHRDPEPNGSSNPSVSSAAGSSPC